MLTHTSLERLAHTQDVDRLLRDLHDNGLPLTLPLRLRASRSDAAWALALRRALELTYLRTTLIDSLAERLIAAQPADDAWRDDADERCPLATAACAAALARLVRDHRLSEDSPEARAAAAGFVALAGLLRPDALWACPDDATDEDRTVTTAFALYLLAEHADAARALPLGAIAEAVDRPTSRLCPKGRQLVQLARNAVETTITPAPAPATADDSAAPGIFARAVPEPGAGEPPAPRTAPQVIPMLALTA